MRQWYSVAGMNLDSPGSSASPRTSIDAVCDEGTFTSSSNPGRQAMAYARGDPVSSNSTSDVRNRSRAVSISCLPARSKLADKRVKVSITGGEDGQMDRRFNET